jgi:hypothetical protein
MNRLLIIIALLVSMMGCQSPIKQRFRDYVAADRLKYQSFNERHKDTEDALLKLSLESWLDRIEAAEKELADDGE